MDPAHPHDSLFALAFGEPRDAASLLRSALPAAIAGAIDWSALRRVDASFVDPQKDDARGDLLFAAPLRRGGAEVLLYLLLEHKSAPARLAPFQMLRYVVRILDRHLADHPGSRSLPPVLPILFHHGAAPWRAPTSLRELFGLGDAVADAAVLDHQPELRLIVDDVAAQSDAALERRNLSLVARVSILFLKHLRRARPDELERLLLAVRDLMTRLLDDPRGGQMLAALCFYAAATSRAGPAEVRAAVHRILEPTTANTIMNGMQKWLLQERTEGKAEGKIEGRAEVLLRQLRRRFGDLPAGIAQRVTAASSGDLDLWADRILDARSLDEVFTAG